MTLAPAVLFDLKLKRDEARVAKGAFVQTDKELRKKEAWSLAVGAYGSELLDEVLHLGEVKQLHMQEIARLKAEVHEFRSSLPADVPPTDRDAAGGASGFIALRAANVARNIEWSAGNTLSLSFRGNEMAGEVGEACNVLKKLDRERMGLVGSRATVDQAAEELADVVICVDLAAMDLGIDLEAAVIAKFNATSEKRGLATRLEPGHGDQHEGGVA